MRLQILVHRRGVDSHRLIWTVNAKSVKQAVQRIPALVRVHSEAHPDCPGFDSYTVSSRSPGNGLWRIADAGRLTNDGTTIDQTQSHRVAG